MLRSRFFLVTMISVPIIAVMILLIAAGYLPPGSGEPTVSPTDDRQLTEGRVDINIDAGASISAQTELSVPQVVPPEGRSLLESYCSQCHLAQSLEEVKKSRSDWEKTLEQMEALGVHLDDNERVELLDYLAVADKP